MLIEPAIDIVKPVVLLVLWSMVMWAWMYITRIPAIQAAGMKLDPNLPRGQQMAELPASVRWKADNYNHLMEQPTLFYALALVLAVIGQGDGWNLYFAYAYVALRIVHSLVQVLINRIELRFLLFVLSNIPLIALLVNTIRALWF